MCVAIVNVTMADLIQLTKAMRPHVVSFSHMPLGKRCLGRLEGSLNIHTIFDLIKKLLRFGVFFSRKLVPKGMVTNILPVASSKDRRVSKWEAVWVQMLTWVPAHT